MAETYNVRYLPESSSVIYRFNSDWGASTYLRVNLKGVAIGGVELSRFAPGRSDEMQALWELVVPLAEVPGEKKADWIPLAHSADLSWWLLRSVGDRTVRLFKP